MKIKSFLPLTLLALSAPVAAQDISVSGLEDASDFSAGILDVGSGGLDRNAWSGTSAELAAHLMSQLPESSAHPVADILIEAALLSGAVPPEGDALAQEDFERARSAYLLATNRGEALSAISERDLDLQRDPVVRTELALGLNDVETACATSDGIQEGRSDPYWAKLRAFCHVVRDEMPAAELTTELLRTSGHDDETFFVLMRAMMTGKAPRKLTPETPLHEAMLGSVSDDRAEQSDLDIVLDGMAGRGSAELLSAFSDLAAQDETRSYTLDDALTDSSDQGTAQLYVLAVSERQTPAMAAFLGRMEAKGRLRDAAKHLSSELSALSDPADVPIGALVRAAVLDDNISSLMSLYQSLAPQSDAARQVALVSDALGGGFRFRPVGEDIETPLMDRDARGADNLMLALALDARMSDRAAMALDDADIDFSNIPFAELLALEAAGAEQARAETALRAADLLSGGEANSFTLSRIVKSLSASGLDRFAQQVAAYEFARIIP